MVVPGGIGHHRRHMDGTAVAHGGSLRGSHFAPQPGIVHPGIAAFHLIGETARHVSAKAQDCQNILAPHIRIPGKSVYEVVLLKKRSVGNDFPASGHGAKEREILRNHFPGELHVGIGNPAARMGQGADGKGELHARIERKAAAAPDITGSQLEDGQRARGLGNRRGISPQPEVTEAQLRIGIRKGFGEPARSRHKRHLRVHVIIHLRSSGNVFHLSRCHHCVVVHSRPGILGEEVPVLGARLEHAPAPAGKKVGPDGAVQILSTPAAVIRAPVGVMAAPEVHAHIPGLHGRVHHVQFRMQGVTHAGFQKERSLLRRTGLRTQLHQIGFELVGAPVGRLVDGVVKVQVEAEHRVRDIPELRGFLDAGRLTGIGIGHLHGGIQVLGIGHGTHHEAGGRYKDFSHANSVFSVSFPPGPGRHPGHLQVYSPP